MGLLDNPVQGSQPGLLSTIGSGLGNALLLPFNVLRSYGEGYAALPGRIHDEAAKRAQALELARKAMAAVATLPPDQQAAYYANPEAFGKSLATNYEAANVNGGDTRVYGDPARGGHMVTAPKVGIDGGQAYTQTPDSFAVTGSRAPSYTETIDAQKAATEAQDKQFTHGTAGLPTGAHPEIGSDGLPTGKWTMDQGFTDFEKEKAQRGATRVSTNVQLPAQSEFAKMMGAQYAKRLTDAQDAAQTADNALVGLNNAKALLDSGKVITGFGADARLTVDRALATAGFQGARDKVADTQVFQSVQKKQVLDQIKALGSGSGISDADRRYVDQIVGGSIGLDSASLGKIISIGQKAAQHRKDVAKTMGEEALATVPAAQGLPRSAFVLPSEAAPAGDSGGGQERLTPEQASALPSGTRFVGMDGVSRVKH